MRVGLLRVVHNILDKKFTKMLKDGAFPKVQYTETVSEWGYKLHSYSMFDYSNTWSRFVNLVDKRIKNELGDINGAFTRKHSAKFLAEIEMIVDSITEDDVEEHPERYRSFADDFMDYAMKG